MIVFDDTTRPITASVTSLTGNKKDTIKYRMTQVHSEKNLFSKEETTQLLRHIKNMVGPYGLYQHATKQTPLLSEGYCTDDNARAVQTLLHLKKFAAPEVHVEIDDILAACWKFLLEAEEMPGIYYNFRSAEGEWLEHGRSDDMYARLFRALANIRAHDTNQDRRQQAQEILPALVITLKKLTAPRAWAEIIIAVSEFPADEQPAYQSLAEQGMEKLRELWRINASSEWPWFEATMTYANALFPHALLRAQRLLPHEDVSSMLEPSTKQLISATIEGDMFVPIGSNGWYPKGGQPSRDNQQPLEAGQTFDFFLDYQEGSLLDEATLLAPYLWLYGKNTHQFSLVDPAQGYCRDGLLASGPNFNCGAESLLAYLWAEVRLKQASPALQAVAAARRSKIVATI